jgi:hypothetical protein
MDLKKESQHCEVTMPREEKNQNEKMMTETKLTRKKARKLMKKKAKLEKLQNVPEETPQKENMHNLSSNRWCNRKMRDNYWSCQRRIMKITRITWFNSRSTFLKGLSSSDNFL